MDTWSNGASGLGKCAICSKETSQHCLGCFEGLDRNGRLSETFYCGKECQKADWHTHKLVCKHNRSRKQLYRAGKLMQAAFYQYRMESFDFSISKIEKHGEDLSIWEGQYQLGQVLSAFPIDLIPDFKDQYTVLSFLTCGDGIVQMQDFARMALHGICKDMREVSFVVDGNRSRRRVIFYRQGIKQDDSRYVHDVLQIILNDGSAYALDVSGALHGFYQPVVPWDVYVQERNVGKTEVKSCGTLSMWSERSLRQFNHSIQGAILLAQREISKGLVKFATAYLKKQETTLADLLNSPMLDYQLNSWRLLGFVSSEMEHFVNKASRHGGLLDVEWCKVQDARN